MPDDDAALDPPPPSPPAVQTPAGVAGTGAGVVGQPRSAGLTILLGAINDFWESKGAAPA